MHCALIKYYSFSYVVFFISFLDMRLFLSFVGVLFSWCPHQVSHCILCISSSLKATTKLSFSGNYLEHSITFLSSHILLSCANLLSGNKLKMTAECVNINAAISYVNFILHLQTWYLFDEYYLLSRYGEGLRAGQSGFDSRRCKIFLFSTALGPTQPPV
jgi:hypothetical protein